MMPPGGCRRFTGNEVLTWSNLCAFKGVCRVPASCQSIPPEVTVSLVPPRHPFAPAHENRLRRTRSRSILLPHLSAAKPVDYIRDVKPLLSKHCRRRSTAPRSREPACVSTPQRSRRWREGPAVVPGKSDETADERRHQRKRPPDASEASAALRDRDCDPERLDRPGSQGPGGEVPDPGAAVQPTGPSYLLCGQGRQEVRRPVSRMRNQIDRFVLAPAPAGEDRTVPRGRPALR